MRGEIGSDVRESSESVVHDSRDLQRRCWSRSYSFHRPMAGGLQPTGFIDHMRSVPNGAPRPGSPLLEGRIPCKTSQ